MTRPKTEQVKEGINVDNNDQAPEPMIKRSAIPPLLKKALADQRAIYDPQLDALRQEVAELKLAAEQPKSAMVYNNMPRQKRNADWQKQLAALRDGCNSREVKGWGQSYVRNYLQDRAMGCGGDRATELVTVLVEEGLLIRKGKKCYYPDHFAKKAA